MIYISTHTIPLLSNTPLTTSAGVNEDEEEPEEEEDDDSFGEGGRGNK